MSTRPHFRGKYPPDWDEIGDRVRSEAGGKCIRCGHAHDPQAGYALTVHHFNGDKSNCQWWNLMALCQRCHLRFQNKVNPDQSYMFEHAEWAKPYVAGFYAWKYECKAVTRQEVAERLEELLAYERIA